VGKIIYSSHLLFPEPWFVSLFQGSLSFSLRNWLIDYKSSESIAYFLTVCVSY
jgi:hypothetical protein